MQVHEAITELRKLPQHLELMDEYAKNVIVRFVIGDYDDKREVSHDYASYETAPFEEDDCG